MDNYSGYQNVRYFSTGTISSYTSCNIDEFQLNGKVIGAMAGKIVTFYESGNVKSLILAKDEKLLVQGIKVKFRAGDSLSFLEDGSIAL